MAVEAVEGGGAGRDLAQVFCRVESAFGVFVVLVEADAVDVGGAADGRDGEDVIPASGLRGRSLFESGDGDGAVLGGAVVGQGAFGDAAGDRVQVVVAGFAANFWEFFRRGLAVLFVDGQQARFGQGVAVHAAQGAVPDDAEHAGGRDPRYRLVNQG